MDPVGFVVVFIITWWLSFFCVLPIGVQGQFEDNGEVIEGSEEGAPKQPMLKKKVVWASGGAVVLTLIAHFAVVPWLASQ
jgi:predicted secreted protein